MTPEERKSFDLAMMLDKVRAMVTREIPERGGAIAAIDQYLRQRDVSYQPEDHSHIDELGMRSRTCEVLETKFGIWSIGQLRALTRRDFRQMKNIGESILQEVITSLDRFGFRHSLAPDRDHREGGVHEGPPEDQHLEESLSRWMSPARSVST